MPSKTVTFSFLKKVKLKFSEASTGFKLGKKKFMDFNIYTLI